MRLRQGVSNNVFRLDGHYEEAAFLRELFDEPVALLYQVHALIQTVQEARDKASIFDLVIFNNTT